MTAAVMAAPRAEVPASSIFMALLRRDMRVARRELPFFLLRTTMQPLMFVFVAVAPPVTTVGGIEGFAPVSAGKTTSASR